MNHIQNPLLDLKNIMFVEIKVPEEHMLYDSLFKI